MQYGNPAVPFGQNILIVLQISDFALVTDISNCCCLLDFFLLTLNTVQSLRQSFFDILHLNLFLFIGLFPFPNLLRIWLCLRSVHVDLASRVFPVNNMILEG